MNKSYEHDSTERDVGKSAYYQQTLVKQMESDKEDQWKIIADKNAEFMKSVEKDNFKEANAHKQYLSKQAGFSVMHTAQMEFEAK